MGGSPAHGDVPDSPSASQSSPATSSAASSPHETKSPAAKNAWLARLTSGDDHGAFELLKALPENEKQTADVRLVTAYLALQAKEHATAKKALTKLESALPELATTITAWRAAAEAHVGPYEQAAQQLASSPKIVNRVTAAQAFLRAGKLKAARKVADTAVKLAERTRRRSEEASARHVRAKIAEGSRQWAVAAADWGWIIRRRPSSQYAREALEGLDRIGGKVSLDHRLNVLARHVSRDSLPTVLKTIDALAPKHRTKKAAISLAHAKAIARTRDWARAVKAYDATARLRSGHRAEARYHAARASERLGQHTDALKRYAAIVRQHPKSGWSERASFRRASLLMRRGEDKKAAWAFAKYLSRYGKSKHAPEARYWRALALLESGQAKRSRTIFSALRKKSRNRREKSHLKHLEGVAAFLAGDPKKATRLWLELCKQAPLTWPALMARARLASINHKPLPPLIGKPHDADLPAAPLDVALPGPVAKLHALGLDDIAEAELKRTESAVTSAHAGRESEALCDAYGQLRVAKQRYRTGNRAVSLAQLMRAPNDRERWTWQCMYPEPYPMIVAKAAKAHQVPASLVYGVMRQESAFRSRAVSHAGAQGLMQVMPQTAKRAAAESKIPGSHFTQPGTNIALGAFYLGKLLRNFGGNLAVATAAYNAGPRAVSHWLKLKKTPPLDLWVARIPYKETRNYAARVVANYMRYQWLKGGEASLPVPDLSVPKTFDIGKDAY